MTNGSPAGTTRVSSRSKRRVSLLPIIFLLPGSRPRSRGGCDQCINRFQRNTAWLVLGFAAKQTIYPVRPVNEPGLRMGRQPTEICQPRFEPSDSPEQI